jgi:hypothetical protein
MWRFWSRMHAPPHRGVLLHHPRCDTLSLLRPAPLDRPTSSQHRGHHADGGGALGVGLCWECCWRGPVAWAAVDKRSEICGCFA